MEEQISKNLPDEARYVLLHKLKKKPIKKNWNTQGVSKEEANTHLKDNKGNVGFLLGNGYLSIDCDSLELQLAVESLIKTKTYTQKSAKRELNQYFFKINFRQESLNLSFKGKEVGEILADTRTGKGKQIVLSPSKYQITQEDVEKCPDMHLKLGNIKKYSIINDIFIAEITKEELLSVILEFDSDLTKQTTQETNEFKQKSSIDDLSITSVLSTTGMTLDSSGKYCGSNPYHSSKGGHNFYITPSKNLAYCFRCDCAISPAKAIALNENIISNCSDELRGLDFIKVLEIAKQKYGIDDEHLKENVKTAQEKNNLEFWTIRDYENYKPNKNYFIEKCLYPNEIKMDYGQTSSFKSMNMLYQAVCIASGKKYLGKFKVKKTAVGILSAENSKKTDKERLKKIMRGLGLRKKDIPLYILPRNFCGDILSFGFKESLFDFIKNKKIEVLFIDTINPVTPELDDNKAKDVTRLFNETLKNLNDEYGVTPVFLHHTDKLGKAFLGSIKFKGLCDSVTRIERKDLDLKFKLFNEKNRDGEVNTLEVGIEFLEKKIKFKLLSEGKAEIFQKAKKMNQEEFFILKLKTLIKDKDTERKEIYDILKSEGVKFKLDNNNKNSTLERAIKIWRDEE